MATSEDNHLTFKRAIGGKAFRDVIIGVGLSSTLINILYLTGSFFMLEVYDRVLPSQSIPSLIALCILALFLYIYQGVLEIMRGRILVRLVNLFDERLYQSIYRLLVELPLNVTSRTDPTQPLRDFDTVKGFLSGAGPSAFFDLPWLPFYIFVCFLFHPVIGYIAIAGSIILVLLTVMTYVVTSKPIKAANEIGGKRQGFAINSVRNAEVIKSMGMIHRLSSNWNEVNHDMRARSARSTDLTYSLGTVSKIFRMALQSGILAAGAVLVIEREASGGIIIAGSILVSRALAPVEIAIANWRSIVSARQSWARLKEFMIDFDDTRVPMELNRPRSSLVVENVTAMPIGGNQFALSDVDFAIGAGSAVGVIGASASGKSTLARVLLGLWHPVRGTVRLDGAALGQWDSEVLGRYIGYLPQDVQLLPGTIAENISRFDRHAAPEVIIAAARAAKVHELILRLPKGYDTYIGDGGAVLSAGQRQRVALARALYGDPFLVVLDEPNSNLDAEGEQALIGAIQGVRNRGGIAIVIAHRPMALASVDLVLVLHNGRMRAFGPKDEVLSKVLQPQPSAPPPRQAPAPASLKLIGTPGEVAE